MPGPCGDPPSSERPGLSAGQATPVCAGKPVPPVTHLAHVSPTSDGKQPSAEKPTPCGQPTPGGKPSSGTGSAATPEKAPSAEKPAPPQTPAAEKPPGKQEPEKEADGDSDDGDGDEEEEEEEDEDEEGGQDEGGNSIFSEDSDKAKEDTFDHELDYGLHESPLNSQEYHDWWGGGDEEELEAKPEGEGEEGEEEEGEGEEGEELHEGEGEEPQFDVWGDLVERGARQPKGLQRQFPRK